MAAIPYKGDEKHSFCDSGCTKNLERLRCKAQGDDSKFGLFALRTPVRESASSETRTGSSAGDGGLRREPTEDRGRRAGSASERGRAVAADPFPLTPAHALARTLVPSPVLSEQPPQTPQVLIVTILKPENGETPSETWALFSQPW